MLLNMTITIWLQPYVCCVYNSNNLIKQVPPGWDLVFIQLLTRLTSVPFHAAHPVYLR